MQPPILAHPSVWAGPAPGFHLHGTLVCFKAWTLPGISLQEFQILQMQLSVTQKPVLIFIIFWTYDCWPFSQCTDIAHLLRTPRLQGLWVSFHTQKLQSRVLVYFCCNLFNLQVIVFLKERWKTRKNKPTCYVSPQD